MQVRCLCNSGNYTFAKALQAFDSMIPTLPKPARFNRSIAEICGGKGGGRPNLAQAGGSEPGKIDEALQFAKSKLQE